MDCIKAVKRTSEPLFDLDNVKKTMEAKLNDLEKKAEAVFFSNLVCPMVDAGKVGHCGMLCSGDSECGDGELCCSNGCGFDCVKAVAAGKKPWEPFFGFQPEMLLKPETKPTRRESNWMCPK